jgi:prolyl 3-hydroxylase /prolyl 3,4-dihydroxylase
MSSFTSTPKRCKLSALVGDENGIMKHLYIPNVFAKPPLKPIKYKPPVAEPGEPPASVDPEAKAQNDAEFEQYKTKVAALKPRVTPLIGMDGLSRLNGVDALALCASDGTLLMGRHNGIVQRWSIPTHTEQSTALLTAQLQDFQMADDLSNKNIKVRRQPGLNLVGISPGPTPGTVISCSSLGRLRLSNLKEGEGGQSTLFSKSMGDDLRRMRGFGASPSIVAMGGREVDLRVFDVTQEKIVFQAKNVSHDWLDMRVPVWCNDLQFLPGHSGGGGSTTASTSSSTSSSSSSVPIMGVATGYGQVRLYDARASQKPVVDINVGDMTDGSERDGRRPLTSICGSLDGRSVVCGNTAGLVCGIDLRMNKVNGMYKGFSGSCRELAQHPTEPLIVSVSIDRHIRVHHTRTRRLLHRIYCKQRLTSLLMLDEASVTGSGSDSEEGADVDMRDAEPDELWDLLEDRERGGKKRSRGKTRRSNTDNDTNHEDEEGEHRSSKKKKCRKSSSSSNGVSIPLETSHFTPKGRQILRSQLDGSDTNSSRPYGCAVITPLCNAEDMLKVHNEAKQNLKATFKETDLFKLYQTDSDLSTMEQSDPETAAKMPSVLALRDSLYTPEFRSFVADITGVTDLTDRVDCSINAYGRGCHLMTHDDVIGTRRVSYIIYFSDPEPAWEFKDGGMLELYPLSKDGKSEKTPPSPPSSSSGVLSGIPAVTPTACLCPAFNTMAMFVVQPGKSYHAVQEVRTDLRPRLSIQGWFHGPNKLEGSDQASLSQIMSRSLGNSLKPTLLLEHASSLPTIKPSMTQEEMDFLYLKEFINPLYLKKSTIEQINDEFCENSSIQLGQFLNNEIAIRMTELTRDADGAFFSSTAATQSNEIPRYSESFMNDGCWSIRGPPHMQRYATMNDAEAMNIIEEKKRKKKKKKTTKRAELTSLLHHLRENVIRSASFGRLIEQLTSLKPTQNTVECRRFRPGMDYTLAHYGMLTRVSQLDATLCFVDGKIT